MARRSFRDRLLAPAVARAVTSPSGLLLAGAAASAGILAGLPVMGWAVLGALAWVGRVAVAVPRDGRRETIDPLSLPEPWNRYVRDALQCHRRFEETVRAVPAGPLRDRLHDISTRLRDAVDECWRVARQGTALADARATLDTARTKRELAELERQLAGTTPDPDSTAGGTLVALRAQVASADRLETTITATRDRLRLLDARMDEAVARAVELSVAGDASEVGVLGHDVDGIVGEMEALRQGLEEADGPPGLPAPGTA